MKKHKKAADELIFCEQTISEIIEHFNLPEDFTTNITRKREYVYGRQIAMYLMTKYTRYSLAKIGEKFGGKDHATVLHAKRTIIDLISTSKNIKREVNIIESRILNQVKIIVEKQSTDDDYFYLNMNNYTSLKSSDQKGILFTGFTEEEIKKIIELADLKELSMKHHSQTGHYILERQ